MEFIRNLITAEEYNRIVGDFPLDSVLLKKINLIIDSQIEENDLDYLNMDTEHFVKFTELKYWLQLIEYDLKCTYGCLIYLIYLVEKVDLEYPKNTGTIMEVQEFSFFFDSALNKLFSLIERISQFVNCLFGLELIENKLGPDGVSLKNVIRELEFRGLLTIKECIDYIDNESGNLRKIRNSITHHFHPLNSPFLEHSIMNDIIRIDKASLHNNQTIDKELISTFQNSFNNINDMTNFLVGVAVGFFKIDCVIIKDKTIVKVAQIKMNFED